MAQVNLTLRPPPNVDFVHGYPGIPPAAPDRPQAAVKGAIEVRVPPQGVKAKWVRIELRKVETLPGGGPANTFYDFVGPSPVNLWNSPDEYGLLRTQDFPFSIRIPESTPPSIALDNRGVFPSNGTDAIDAKRSTAGITYELVASVCTKGKKGFLRKAKSIVVSTQAPVIIDKHELHSTWPIYCQPETRHLAQEGVNLIVDRNHTCFGPGDRVAVSATVKSDSLHTVILRGFEITLKESTVYRAGPFAAAKKSAPQVRVLSVCESKVPVNVTLYGGSSHQEELSCMISANHTTTTLNAARHIDVTYTLTVKALMGTGNHLVMDLPVIVSNWQRHVSAEAIRRIGPTPNLSLLPISHTGTPTAAQNFSSQIGRPVSNQAAPASTLPTGRGVPESSHTRQLSGNAFATANPALASTTPKLPVDEFGYGGRPNQGRIDESANPSSRPVILPINTSGAAGSSSAAAAVHSNSQLASANTSITTGRRPNSARSNGGGNRLTIVNAQPAEIPQDSGSRNQRDRSGSGGRQWPSAEEEKKLYESARQRVEKTQPHVTLIPVNSPPPQGVAAAASPANAPAQPQLGGVRQWPTAEEEKSTLFNKAQQAVLKTHNSPQPNHTRSNSDLSRGPSGSKPASTGAALYQEAMAARKNPSSSSQAQPAIPLALAPKVPQYLTAEQEKAALRRYEEAKRAVDRTQASVDEPSGPVRSSSQSGPIAYESLFPSAASGSSSRPSIDDAPPPFAQVAAAGSSPLAVLSEKERMRRKYEEDDAAALARQNSANAAQPPPAAYTPPIGGSSPAQFASAVAEKEALRRKLEAKDRAAAAATAKNNPSLSHTPPRSNSTASRSPHSATSPGFRPTPLPPTAGGSSRIPTAAEEKALLKAKYEAKDAAAEAHFQALSRANGNGRANGIKGGALSPPPPHTPPPLKPRPPVEYIQETQEEDARVSRFANTAETPRLDDPPHDYPTRKGSGSCVNGGG